MTIKLTEQQARESHQLYQKGQGSVMLARIYNVTSVTLRGAWRRYGLKVRSVEEAIKHYSIDSTFFNTIDTEEKAYFLGFLFADGCMEKGTNAIHLELHRDDRCIIEWFLKALKTDRPIRPTKGGKYAAISIDNKQLYADLLKKHGLEPEKSHKLFGLPASVPKHLLYHFVRGYFDGDGSAYIEKSNGSARCNMISNHQFIAEIGELFAAEVWKHENTPSAIKPSRGCIYTSSIEVRSTADVTAVYRYLYDGATVFLPRKKAVFEAGLPGVTLRANNSRLAYLNYDFLTSAPTWDTEANLLKELQSIARSVPTIASSQSHVGTHLRRHFFPQIYTTGTKHAPSMQTAFADEKRLEKAYANRNKYGYQINDIHMALRGMRLSGGGGLPSFFGPTLAKWFYQTYCNNNEVVFDPAAGWGDRFIASQLAGKNLSYIGIDSSPLQIASLEKLASFMKANASSLSMATPIQLKPRNGASLLATARDPDPNVQYLQDNMIKALRIPKEFLGPDINASFIYGYSESVDVPMYDVMFSCMPYYDSESFQNQELYGSFEEWLEHYWRTTIANVLPKCRRLFAYIATNELAKQFASCVPWPIQEQHEIRRSKGCTNKSKGELLVIHSNPTSI